MNTSPIPKFVIRRPGDFAEWFAGFNANGPMWSSVRADARKVDPPLLVPYMQEMAKHQPCAMLAGKERI